eukprot:CAMPEP_0118632024 /NCGR_PEP_ID=MMETSP0785-20121206/217_1 /TAXON_ID=91992 /ORGANISM="Bolidomonas pacifica, Strain CCMP 1866" /LENGTH=127 /DNA_ID=CAMNT_0006522753 /DNA_START=9 /DNA_END=389 /DNA_ORIENTATION=+
MKDKGSRVSRDTQVLYNEVIGMLAEEGLRNKVVKKGRWEGRECLDVAVEVLEYMRDEGGMGFVPRPNTRSYVGVLKGASRCKKGRAMLIGKKVKGVNEEMHRRSQRGKVGRKLRFEPRFLNAYLRCY